MKSTMAAAFALHAPCDDCPFRRVGAIELRPGRLQGIIDGLLADDLSVFHCHKTVHHARTGGAWDEAGQYHVSGQESLCVGALVYLQKCGQPSVAMRLGHLSGVYEPARLSDSFDAVIDP